LQRLPLCTHTSYRQCLQTFHPTTATFSPIIRHPDTTFALVYSCIAVHSQHSGNGLFLWCYFTAFSDRAAVLFSLKQVTLSFARHGVHSKYLISFWFGLTRRHRFSYFANSPVKHFLHHFSQSSFLVSITASFRLVPTKILNSQCSPYHCLSTALKNFRDQPETASCWNPAMIPPKCFAVSSEPV